MDSKVPVAAPPAPPKAHPKKLRRILIVGVSGYVGSALAAGLKNDFEVFGIYNRNVFRLDGVTTAHVDITSSNDLVDFLTVVDPDAILYCVNLGFDESIENPLAAELFHFKVPSLFSKIYKKPHTFLYFSTDVVYGQETCPGGRKAFVEKDSPAPKSAYGTTKMSGEGVTLANGTHSFVFRLATVYGENMGGPSKMRSTWLSQIHAKLEAKHRVVAYTDQYRNFVYIGDVVRAVRDFLQEPPRDVQLYNIAGPLTLSRFDLAQRYCEQFGIPTETLVGVPSSEDMALANPRPKNCALDARKFEREFDFKFQPVTEGLVEMFERLRTGYTRSWT